MFFIITCTDIDLMFLYCNCKRGQLGSANERRTQTSGFALECTPVALKSIPVTPLR